MCQKHLQKYVRSNAVLASIPCGGLDDLLELDFTGCNNVQLVGVDIDIDALRLAESNALAAGLHNCVALKQADAWQLDVQQQYDVLTTKGLVCYEPNLKKVSQLHQQFYQALKPGGVYIADLWLQEADRLKPLTSQEAKDWEKYNIIMERIVSVRFTRGVSRKQLQEILENAGFVNVTFDTEPKGLLAVVTAIKPD